ncbi:uncharacterized protein DS421_3g95400 [Arachis hypogaea]|nr:uncharacterized protein DS421_3g95400 [Arachis hypogaea]
MKRQKEKGENGKRKEEEQKGEERETAPVGITATVAVVVLSGGRSEEERESVELREQRNTPPPPDAVVAAVALIPNGHHRRCRERSRGATVAPPPLLGRRAVSVAVKQSAHRGEAVQATAKSPSMKIQPPYLWLPKTAVGAATFLGLFIASCFVVRRCQSYHSTTTAFALSR